MTTPETMIRQPEHKTCGNCLHYTPRVTFLGVMNDGECALHNSSTEEYSTCDSFTPKDTTNARD